MTWGWLARAERLGRAAGFAAFLVFCALGLGHVGSSLLSDLIEWLRRGRR